MLNPKKLDTQFKTSWPKTYLKEIVFDKILKIGNFETAEKLHHSPDQVPIYKKMSELIDRDEKLIFILPAFPAKSANRKKTSGPVADLGEVIALQRLQTLCEEISYHYPPGVEVLICSDGKVLNDLVFVNETDLNSYKASILSIIDDFSLHYLKTYCLEDYYSSSSQTSLQQQLVQDFGPAIEALKELVRSDSDTKSMFNGLHRFIKEDMLGLNPDKSKSQICKESKEIAYKVIQRSRSWDNLLADQFKDTLRLSIHPYPLDHHKFGIQLVPSRSRWATPWHNVVLKTAQNFKLVKRSESLDLGATKKMYKESFAYYEI